MAEEFGDKLKNEGHAERLTGNMLVRSKRHLKSTIKGIDLQISQTLTSMARMRYDIERDLDKINDGRKESLFNRTSVLEKHNILIKRKLKGKAEPVIKESANVIKSLPQEHMRGLSVITDKTHTEQVPYGDTVHLLNEECPADAYVGLPVITVSPPSTPGVVDHYGRRMSTFSVSLPDLYQADEEPSHGPSIQTVDSPQHGERRNSAPLITTKSFDLSYTNNHYKSTAKTLTHKSKIKDRSLLNGSSNISFPPILFKSSVGVLKSLPKLSLIKAPSTGLSLDSTIDLRQPRTTAQLRRCTSKQLQELIQGKTMGKAMEKTMGDAMHHHNDNHDMHISKDKDFPNSIEEISKCRYLRLPHKYQFNHN